MLLSLSCWNIPGHLMTISTPSFYIWNWRSKWWNVLHKISYTLVLETFQAATISLPAQREEYLTGVKVGAQGLGAGTEQESGGSVWRVEKEVEHLLPHRVPCFEFLSLLIVFGVTCPFGERKVEKGLWNKGTLKAWHRNVVTWEE